MFCFQMHAFVLETQKFNYKRGLGCIHAYGHNVLVCVICSVPVVCVCSCVRVLCQIETQEKLKQIQWAIAKKR